MERPNEEEAPMQSLFPVYGVAETSQNLTADSDWLINKSFTTDLSIVNDAVSAHQNQPQHQDDDDEQEEEQQEHEDSKNPTYELLESDDGSQSDDKKKKKKKRKKTKRKRKREIGIVEGLGSRRRRKSNWADSDSHGGASKDYYFDSRGDPDNLAFGSLYKMDVPRYKMYDFDNRKMPMFGSQALYRRGPAFDMDSDVDALDSKLKSGGRYWSAKYAALERHANLKRVRVIAPEKKTSHEVVEDDFIPMNTDVATSDKGDGLYSLLIVEESWEDEMLRKTREFNKLTRENPHDEKAWLAFAEFQDRVVSMQPTKGARLQALEKKIGILEKAVELNPDNEELLLCLLKAYHIRDSTDVFIGRWEKILMQHSGNYKLWREFLHVVQGEFSRFKVSEMRKMYGHAIQALSAACSRQSRQVQQTDGASPDPSVVQLELGLVDIFLSLCRFEWQAGYQEMATALFQAEVEYSLFCPLILSEQSKQRLFEHFWNSDGARVGEEGALGWSTWLQKEEESRQQLMKEESLPDNEEGGWTGWSEPLSKNNLETTLTEDLAAEESHEEEIEDEVIKEEEDTEALLKSLGIDVDVAANSEVNDTVTWIRWSEEESLRDSNQWMPVRTTSGRTSHTGETSDQEADEQILRAVMYEDVSEYLFSLCSEEARLSLVSQFIEFYGGRVSQSICTNATSWTEKFLSLESLPLSIGESLRKIDDVLIKQQNNSSGYSLESLLGNVQDISKQSEMMKFIRNATLCCLSTFTRNYMLEEAALVSEELSVTKMSSCSSPVTPCRALAKSLLKSDRQDILLCGVYARREAVFGNIDHARRVFDMALSSVEGLPPDMKPKAPLLYLWYAETELAKNFHNASESSYRALHILSCLGSGTPHSPYKGQPSSVQLLKARQGFKEKIIALRSKCIRGHVDDQCIALICSAALLEELTTGCTGGIEVLNQAFTIVLPERRSHSNHLEYLFNFQVKMLQRHRKQISLSKVWESILQGLQIYPFSLELFTTLVETSHVYTTPNNLRWIFDDYCHKKPSVIVWLFALAYEMGRGGPQPRIHGLFERALANDQLRNCVLLWRAYISYEVHVVCNPSAAKRIFFRAIHACPWSKKLWLDGFLKLNSTLTPKELSDLQEVMRDKELNLRTDIYEILLRDELG